MTQPFPNFIKTINPEIQVAQGVSSPTTKPRGNLHQGITITWLQISYKYKILKALWGKI